MKILLVEDSMLLREIITDFFISYEHIDISQFADTQISAIDRLNLQQFDMLLLDIELAQGNGFEVIKHMQTSDYTFKPPMVMILSNNNHPHYRKYAKELGVHHFFDKSMDFLLAIDTIIASANTYKTTKPH